MNDFRLDRRRRRRSDVTTIDPHEWFTATLPGLLEHRGAEAAGAAERLGLRPLVLDIDGSRFGLQVVDGRLEGAASDGTVVQLGAASFSDWINWLATVQRLTVSGEMTSEPRSRFQVMGWELVLRWLTDGVAVHEPGAVAFVDRHGLPLDLTRHFTPTDDPGDIAHFLREAGFLHLRGWLDADDIEQISRDMDAAAPSYRPDDGRSWWATLASGEEVCVRMRYFVEHSPTTARLLASEQWDRVRRVIAGDEELVRAPVEGNIIEALFKPLGVVAGISDVPWHRDCSLGGHPFQCAGVTVGISVTAGTETSGLLRVVAGSHRTSSLDDPAWRRNDLPVVPLPTEAGDITVHIACTCHEALPPSETPRRVMYTGFGLPPNDDDPNWAGAAPARDLRNEAYKLTSQPPTAERTR